LEWENRLRFDKNRYNLLPRVFSQRPSQNQRANSPRSSLKSEKPQNRNEEIKENWGRHRRELFLDVQKIK